MPPSTKSKRILALDVMRGITIAGMILVNNPGGGGEVFAPLCHAQWIGLTPTDFVFPFFMFIMGITTFISLRKYNFQPSAQAIKKIVVRTIVIMLVGAFISFFAHFVYYWGGADTAKGFGTQMIEALNVLPTLRLTGVLYRLAICYCIVTILALLVNHKWFPWIITALFIGYFLILEFGNGYAYDETNIIAIVDNALLGPAHVYRYETVDPEGLLSTIPSVAHVMIGFMAGRMMLGRQTADEAVTNDTGNVARLITIITKLFILGTALLVAGFLLSYACPISKKLWTPTFSMVTCGFGALVLALLIYIIDIRGKKSWSRFFEAFGVNPLFLYVMSDIFAILLGVSFYTPISEFLVSIFGLNGGPLAYAILFVLLNYAVVALPLYKHKIYIKI